MIFALPDRRERHLGNRRMVDRASHHLNYFDFASAATFLERLGFRVVERTRVSRWNSS